MGGLHAVLRGQARREQPPTTLAVRVRVIKPPIGFGEPLTLEPVNTPGLVDICEQWPARTALPAAGDEGLAIYDETAEPWIVFWATSEISPT